MIGQNQEGVDPLEVNINPTLPEVPYTAEFTIPDDHKGKIYVTQQTFGNRYHPISVSTEKPETLSNMDPKELIYFYLVLRSINQKEMELESLKTQLDAINNPVDPKDLN